MRPSTILLLKNHALLLTNDIFDPHYYIDLISSRGIFDAHFFLRKVVKLVGKVFYLFCWYFSKLKPHIFISFYKIEYNRESWVHKSWKLLIQGSLLFNPSADAFELFSPVLTSLTSMCTTLFVLCQNGMKADKRWMLCSVLFHFGGLLPRGLSHPVQNRILADLSNFQHWKTSTS